MCYVYRFLSNQQAILYVGKTESLQTRMQTHFSQKGHLPKACYDQTNKIEYIELPSKIDMKIAELYYINKWKPLYNTADKQEEPLSVQIQEHKKWKVYKSKQQEKVDALHTTIKEQQKTIAQLKKQQVTMLRLQEELASVKHELACGIQQKHLNFNPTFSFSSSENVDESHMFSLNEINTLYKENIFFTFTGTLQANGKERTQLFLFPYENEVMVKDCSNGNTLYYNDCKRSFEEFSHAATYYWDLAAQTGIIWNYIVEDNAPVEWMRSYLQQLQEKQKKVETWLSHDIQIQIPQHLFRLFIDDFWHVDIDKDTNINEFVIHWIKTAN